MNKEEKKAVELIKKQIDFCKNNTECREELNQCFGCTIEVEDVNALEIILNLIEKQEENNKKLKNQLTDIHSNFLKFNWEESNGKQVHNQLKELYESIYRKGEEDE